MNSVKHKWQRTPTAVRKPLVLVVGVAVVAAGIAMLVLPGPGWAAIFLGFAILATEFTAAEKVRDWMVVQFKKAAAWAKKTWRACFPKRKA